MEGLKLKNMASLKPKIFVVDDEPYNLEILTEYLEDEGHLVECAQNGTQALQTLRAHPEKFHTVLLDRMLPDMDGIEVLRCMKTHPELKLIPTIIQSAKATRIEIQEGLDAGVLYYVTKPFNKKTLLAIVNTALVGFFSNNRLLSELSETQEIAESGQFECQTLEQARGLAMLLAHACPDPRRVVLGLSELLINAIEHGNLGIGYQTKTRLHEQGNWQQEIEHRLSLVQNHNKKVRVTFTAKANRIEFLIRDEGQGFDSKHYLMIDPKRAINTHGRGIALAKIMSFDLLRYNDSGNEVLAVVNR